MKLYPAKKVEGENDKKRKKKATADWKPQQGLSFMGKYFRKTASTRDTLDSHSQTETVTQRHLTFFNNLMGDTHA